MTDYAAVLSENYPDAEWVLDGDDYSGLTWIGPGNKPSQADLDAAWFAVQQAQADAVAADQAARQSAIDKLAALGLSVDEIRVAFGLAGS